MRALGHAAPRHQHYRCFHCNKVMEGVMVSSDEYNLMFDMELISPEYGSHGLLFFIRYCMVNENTGVVSIQMNIAE